VGMTVKRRTQLLSQLAGALEAQDPYLAGHSRRVARHAGRHRLSRRAAGRSYTPRRAGHSRRRYVRRHHRRASVPSGGATQAGNRDAARGVADPSRPGAGARLPKLLFGKRAAGVLGVACRRDASAALLPATGAGHRKALFAARGHGHHAGYNGSRRGSDRRTDRLAGPGSSPAGTN
jgi:hypothetical protein